MAKMKMELSTLEIVPLNSIYTYHYWFAKYIKKQFWYNEKGLANKSNVRLCQYLLYISCKITSHSIQSETPVCFQALPARKAPVYRQI